METLLARGAENGNGFGLGRTTAGVILAEAVYGSGS